MGTEAAWLQRLLNAGLPQHCGNLASSSTSVPADPLAMPLCPLVGLTQLLPQAVCSVACPPQSGVPFPALQVGFRALLSFYQTFPTTFMVILTLGSSQRSPGA